MTLSPTQVVTGDRTPEFTWNASTGDSGGSGFASYEITIVDSKAPKTGDRVFFNIGTKTGDTTFTLGARDALPDDQYRAEVRAVDVAGNRSAPATADFFVDLSPPATPQALVKTTLDNVRSPNFKWALSTDDGVGLDFYQIHVQSVGLVDIFAPPAPVLISPTTGGFVRTADITFSWRQVQDRTRVTYRLQIDKAGEDFSSPDFSTGDIPDTSGTVVFTLPESVVLTAASYKWRARATDDGRNVGAFSEVRIFTTVDDGQAPPKPQLERVEPFSTGDGTPTFVWKQVVGTPAGEILTYSLQIATESTFTDLAATADGIQVINFTLPQAKALTPRQYHWRVRAVDRVGNTGDFSDQATFIVQSENTAPPTPVLRFPTHDSTADGRAPTFQWTQVTDVNGVTYIIEIAKTGDPATGDNLGAYAQPVFTADVPDVPVSTGGESRIQFTVPVNSVLEPGMTTSGMSRPWMEGATRANSRPEIQHPVGTLSLYPLITARQGYLRCNPPPRERVSQAIDPPSIGAR